MHNIRPLIPAIVGAPLAVAAVIAVGGGVVMRLWNRLLPPLFGWPVITIWGFGLLALCRILFGGFGSRGGGHSTNFSSQNRERFRRRMRARVGGGTSDGERGCCSTVSPDVHAPEPGQI